ncbi:hypothetical protein [Achromobacter insuavis]|uniref:hypothetical protein n=1 Tax=Achromobacter insuavis TaxID=1287735 RepID=UPI0029DB40FB|nr:hypothetical protein [Achromobacter sp.]MCG2605129.1 hypothetical protein [Achromobacter sp.]
MSPAVLALLPGRHGVPALVGIAAREVAAFAAPLRQRGPFGIGGQVPAGAAGPRGPMGLIEIHAAAGRLAGQAEQFAGAYHAAIGAVEEHLLLPSGQNECGVFAAGKILPQDQVHVAGLSAAGIQHGAPSARGAFHAGAQRVLFPVGDHGDGSGEFWRSEPSTMTCQCPWEQGSTRASTP